MSNQTSTSLDANEKSYYLKEFTKLDLAGQSLQDIEFEVCTFVDCDFSDAVMRNFRFIDCTFLNCRLSHLKLPSTRFRSAILENCKVVDVDWTALEWSRLTSDSELTFRECVLTDSVFFGLSLDGMVMQSCKAHGIDLREASLKGADLSYTDFTNAQFGRTNLTDADFTEATEFNIDVLNNVMTRSKFSRIEAARLLHGLDIEVVD